MSSATKTRSLHGHIERLNTFPHFSLKISAFQSDNIAAPFPVLSVGKKSITSILPRDLSALWYLALLWLMTYGFTPSSQHQPLPLARMTLVQQIPAAQSLCQEFLWP